MCDSDKEGPSSGPRVAKFQYKRMDLLNTKPLEASSESIETSAFKATNTATPHQSLERQSSGMSTVTDAIESSFDTYDELKGKKI
jgi:hypothetical protein